MSTTHKVWRFGADIDTDQLAPGAYMKLGIEGIAPHCLEAVRPEFAGAVQRGDVARLTRVPGVGRKTSERIILELKDRLGDLAVSIDAPTGAPVEHRLRDDLLSALQNLGYQRPLAEKAIESVLAASADASFEQALRAALRELMR